jgi:FkbM family methyltransferase
MGYTVTPNWRIEGLPLEQHLRQLFTLLDIKCVLDVGANVGQYKDFVRNRVGFDKQIHSFEPVPDLAKQLIEKAKSDPAWHIHPHALGSQETSLEINVMSRDTFSSFLEPNNTQATDFANSNTVQSKQLVAVKRLDDVARDWSAAESESIYLKVDTQGFDLEVLKGATHLLKSVRALQIELSIVPIYQGTPSYLDMLRQMNDWGFHISGLFPISHDKHLRAVEFDCVMVSMNQR